MALRCRPTLPLSVSSWLRRSRLFRCMPCNSLASQCWRACCQAAREVVTRTLAAPSQQQVDVPSPCHATKCSWARCAGGNCAMTRGVQMPLSLPLVPSLSAALRMGRRSLPASGILPRAHCWQASPCLAAATSPYRRAAAPACLTASCSPHAASRRRRHSLRPRRRRRRRQRGAGRWRRSAASCSREACSTLQGESLLLLLHSSRWRRRRALALTARCRLLATARCRRLARRAGSKRMARRSTRSLSSLSTCTGGRTGVAVARETTTQAAWAMP